MADDNLSDEQLQQLLKDAEQRMRAKGKKPSTASEISALSQSIPKIASDKKIDSYIKATANGPQIDSSHLVSEQQRKLANSFRVVEDPIAVKKKAEKTNLTPELKRDLQLLRMRDVLDPKRFYKKESGKPKIPEFSQVGTIIEGPTEYFSARLSNKDRKRTLVEEVLAGEVTTGRFKSKYNEIQAAKTSGKKAHYKKLKAMRKSGGVSKR
ncbi:putative rRNA-processing protein fcf2 [Acephala macrosclerotiorum]|nr:putative rRNA-processing protein fcf2 [Acephala macrosclerotiorum]